VRGRFPLLGFVLASTRVTLGAHQVCGRRLTLAVRLVLQSARCPSAMDDRYTVFISRRTTGRDCCSSPECWSAGVVRQRFEHFPAVVGRCVRVRLLVLPPQLIGDLAVVCDEALGFSLGSLWRVGTSRPTTCRGAGMSSATLRPVPVPTLCSVRFLGAIRQGFTLDGPLCCKSATGGYVPPSSYPSPR
jgi:hypothetical protein